MAASSSSHLCEERSSELASRFIFGIDLRSRGCADSIWHQSADRWHRYGISAAVTWHQALHIGATPRDPYVPATRQRWTMENPSSNQNLRVSRVSNSHLGAKSHIWKYFRVFGDFFCLKIAKFSLKSAERAPRVPGRPLQSLEDDRGGNTVICEALHWTSRTEMRPTALPSSWADPKTHVPLGRSQPGI